MYILLITMGQVPIYSEIMVTENGYIVIPVGLIRSMFRFQISHSPSLKDKNNNRRPTGLD